MGAQPGGGPWLQSPLGQDATWLCRGPASGNWLGEQKQVASGLKLHKGLRLKAETGEEPPAGSGHPTPGSLETQPFPTHPVGPNYKFPCL